MTEQAFRPSAGMTPLQRRLAEQINHALRASGTTQATLAIRAGITEKHLSQIMLGREMGSLAVWQALATALGRAWNVSLL